MVSETIDLTVVLAEPTDLPAVMALLRRCVQDMQLRGIDQWDELYPNEGRFASDLSTGSLYIARVPDGRLVGAFTLDERQDAEYAAVPWTLTSDRTAVVHRLMVEPNFQGRGLARILMHFAEREAAARGCGAMRLDAFTENPRALSLYRGLGYHDAGEVSFRKGRFRCFEKRLLA